MKFDFLQTTLDRLWRQRNASLVLNLLMGLSNVLLIVGWLGRDEKVILLPPSQGDSWWVTKQGACAPYLEQMSLYLVQLLLNITPKTAALSHEKFLTYVTPSAYGQFKKALLRKLEESQRSEISSTFYPTSITIDQTSSRTKAQGLLYQYVAGKLISTSERIYWLTYTLSHGRFFVENFEEEEKK